ncbi:MAG: hypothetical protein JW734_07150, partial [Candidatus Omnitrophica bacterium]|nr:hypothetical protein [Candidatus Omnitrophota bacterium]
MKKTLILSLGLVFVLQGVGLGYGWLSQPSSKMPETSFSDNQENTAAEKTLDFFVLSGMKDHEIVKTLSEMKHDRLADVFNAAFERPTLKLRAAIWLKGLEEKKQQAALK